MAFVDQLGANSGPPVRSGIYGQPDPNSNEDTLSIVNRLKDREMMDFQNKANFMADLSLRQQQRMRTLLGPEDSPSNTNLGQRQTVETGGGSQPNPDSLSMNPLDKLNPMQKLDYGLKQQELAQKGKFGQEALDIKTASEKLAQQKSDQINELKHEDLQRKVDESKSKLDEANQKLKQAGDNFKLQLAAHQAIADATAKFHEASLAQKDHEFQTTSKQHQDQIDALQKRVKDQENVSTTTELDPSGNKKIVTTKRGDAANAPVRNQDGTYTVTAPDGTKGIIPADKLDHWMTNYHGKDQNDQSQDEDNNDAS